jgi:NMD protein affecting ribosome stability and mRNA decay
MILCLRCGNETRTTAVVTSDGRELVVAGTIARDPQPISAEVCSACGFVQLFAPQPFQEGQQLTEAAREPVTLGELVGEPSPPVA